MRPNCNRNLLNTPGCKRFAKTLMLMFLATNIAAAQGGHPTPPPPPPGAKSARCSGRPVPQLEDITAKTGITFKHTPIRRRNISWSP